ncbi:Tryptophanase [Spironucleus salmonicida]|uniref:Tryptophanase n=1 Tax=Spironucleus salmonicida TaxID=348837 RepID=V6LYW6_9EUKA|nr:Tryptophanase [Spironucleus salmonicida]KAH0577385.1 Tryptophanase [Spironucleus salmonicida]KAH0577397.1 Tryptophanase [Spironucleus salmonicida]|eukprot:EST48919.1 Tryptophanase [Spironucleus salmonicida]
MQAMEPAQQLAYLTSFYDRFEAWKTTQADRVSQIPPELLVMAQALNSAFRPFINHVVKPKNQLAADPREEFQIRAAKVIEVGLNSFYMPADHLEVDFLSDSGSSAMTTAQWGQMMQGDESYGSNEGWYQFNDTMADIFGERYASVFLGKHRNQALNEQYKLRKNFNYIVNQGRGAENQLFPALAQALVNRDYRTIEGAVDYNVICTNNFFDTTSGHILDITDKPFRAPDGKTVRVTFNLMNHPNPKVRDGTYCASDKYLGDGDFELLSRNVEAAPGKTAIVFTTITNNSGGSQPVSLQHIEAVSALCKKHGIPYIMDACRFAENAYLIKTIEDSPLSVREIVHKTFALVDGFTISLKKDGIANCGGAVCFAPESVNFGQFVGQETGCILQQIMDGVILKVGHFTYGALTGRDIKAACAGLQQVVEFNYLKGRIDQVQRFAAQLKALGIPVLDPCGTSAVYIDVDRFFGRDKRAQFLGNALVGLMLAKGIRGCELGVSAFYSPHGNAPYKSVEAVSGNFVRLAIPRQLYSDSDLDAAALWIKFLFDCRADIRGVVDRAGLRQLSLHHFKMQFDYAQ